MANILKQFIENNREIYIMDDYIADADESYIGENGYNIKLTGDFNATTTYGDLQQDLLYDANIYIASGTFNPNYNIYHALYLDTIVINDQNYIVLRIYNPQNQNGIVFNGSDHLPTITNIGGAWFNDNVGGFWRYPMVANVSTNLPIFDTYAKAQAYCEAATDPARKLALKQAANYRIGETPEGDEFEITNPWIHGTWTQYGVSTTGNIAYRNVRGKINSEGILAFYKIPYQSGDTALKYGIKSVAEFSALQYSIDGLNWQNVDYFPFDFFYRERSDELGTFDFAYSFGFSRFTIWPNEEDAIDFIQGRKDIEEALNWPEISGGYPVFNPTGDEEEETEFGHVYTEGFFSQQYILNATALREIANGLFDTQSQGIWEAIKQGIEMFGADPIQAVMGLSFWPFPLTEIFSHVSSQRYVYFGGYQFNFEESGSSCHRIIYPDGYKTIASTHMIKRRFHSWRDFEPYTKLYIMLPYIGTYQLDLARYYDKVLEVRYYCDTRTNSVIAALIADGTLIDYFNGQMGCTMPITLTDYSGFANAQINTLLGAGGQAANAFGNGISQAPLMAGSAAGFVGGAAGIALSGAAVGAKTVYGLSQNNINDFNKTKGGSTSMINQNLPQKVILIWEMMEDCAPANYGQMFGYPSMMSGKLSSFSGFLKCQAVKLECGIATERERERLKQMLLSGIYI